MSRANDIHCHVFLSNMSSAVRSNSAKRSASGNLSNSSDDEQEDQLRDLEPNGRSLSISTATASDLDTTSSLDCSDNPCSPGTNTICYFLKISVME